MKVRKVVLLLLMMCCSCASLARVHMNDATSFDAEIVGSTESEIVVKPKHGPTQSVKRSDVADIDHPGTWGIGGGVFLVIFAAGFIGVGVNGLLETAERRAMNADPTFSDSLQNSFSNTVGWTFIYMGGFSLLAGIPSIVVGTNLWTSSKKNAELPGVDSVDISFGGTGLSFKASF